MTIGPVQLLVLGFPEPDFHGQVVAELERLRRTDTVRVIDAIALHKDSDGAIDVLHLSNISDEEAAELSTAIGALVGLDLDGDGDSDGDTAEVDGQFLAEENAWDVVGDIPNGTAAALVLLEHRWAVPLRDAIADAGGYRVGDAFISPLDLAEIGLVTQREARRLHDQEKGFPGVAERRSPCSGHAG